MQIYLHFSWTIQKNYYNTHPTFESKKFEVRQLEVYKAKSKF